MLLTPFPPAQVPRASDLDDPEAWQEPPLEEPPTDAWDAPPDNEPPEEPEQQPPLARRRKQGGHQQQCIARRARAKKARADASTLLTNAPLVIIGAGGLAQAPPGVSLPNSLGSIHASHDLVAAGGLAVCTRCARASSTNATTAMANRCAAVFKPGSDVALRAVCRGRLPKAWRAWPDGCEPSTGERLAYRIHRLEA